MGLKCNKLPSVIIVCNVNSIELVLFGIERNCILIPSLSLFLKTPLAASGKQSFKSDAHSVLSSPSQENFMVPLIWSSVFDISIFY